MEFGRFLAAALPATGENVSIWPFVLLDYGCLCIHVFSPEAREFYSLERLWQDGKPLDLSDILKAD